MLARSIALRCGTDILPGSSLDLLTRAVDLFWLRQCSVNGTLMKGELLRSYWQLRNELDAVKDSSAMCLTRQRRLWHQFAKESRGVNFRDLISSLPHTECSDPRDRIYSLLSLIDVEELHPYFIIFDYPMSRDELLRKLVRRDSPSVDHSTDRLSYRVVPRRRENSTAALSVVVKQMYKRHVRRLTSMLELEHDDAALDLIFEKAQDHSSRVYRRRIDVGQATDTVSSELFRFSIEPDTPSSTSLSRHTMM